MDQTSTGQHDVQKRAFAALDSVFTGYESCDTALEKWENL